MACLALFCLLLGIVGSLAGACEIKYKQNDTIASVNGKLAPWYRWVHTSGANAQKKDILCAKKCYKDWKCSAVSRTGTYCHFHSSKVDEADHDYTQKKDASWFRQMATENCQPKGFLKTCRMKLSGDMPKGDMQRWEMGEVDLQPYGFKRSEECARQCGRRRGCRSAVLNYMNCQFYSRDWDEKELEFVDFDGVDIVLLNKIRCRK